MNKILFLPGSVRHSVDGSRAFRLPASRLYTVHQIQLHRVLHRFKDIQTKQDKLYDLMRLMVKKMDIHEEADQLEEGSKRTGRMSKNYKASKEAIEKWDSSATQAKLQAVRAFSTK